MGEVLSDRGEASRCLPEAGSQRDIRIDALLLQEAVITCPVFNYTDDTLEGIPKAAAKAEPL